MLFAAIFCFFLKRKKTKGFPLQSLMRSSYKKKYRKKRTTPNPSNKKPKLNLIAPIGGKNLCLFWQSFGRIAGTQLGKQTPKHSLQIKKKTILKVVNLRTKNYQIHKMEVQIPYIPINKVRIVTAAALFDGHDAAINIMRRIIQSTGVEVIHLGHDRSVDEVVNTAIQEDANAIALTSYQGGHNEYFKYMRDLLNEKGAAHIKIFGGGGGVILPSEIAYLEAYGITKIYSPDDGRAMGLQGMINDLVQKSDFAVGDVLDGEVNHIASKDARSIARIISSAENFLDVAQPTLDKIKEINKTTNIPVLGITGTGGS